MISCDISAEANSIISSQGFMSDTQLLTQCEAFLFSIRPLCDRYNHELMNKVSRFTLHTIRPNVDECISLVKEVYEEEMEIEDKAEEYDEDEDEE